MLCITYWMQPSIYSRQKVEDETNHLQCFVFNGLNYCVEQSPTNPTSRIHLNTRIAFIQSSKSLSSLAAFIPIIIIMLVGQTTRWGVITRSCHWRLLKITLIFFHHPHVSQQHLHHHHFTIDKWKHFSASVCLMIIPIIIGGLANLPVGYQLCIDYMTCQTYYQVDYPLTLWTNPIWYRQLLAQYTGFQNKNQWKEVKYSHTYMDQPNYITLYFVLQKWQFCFPIINHKSIR